jgi:DNA-binding LacI/PurR family transcriptional regulator
MKNHVLVVMPPNGSQFADAIRHYVEEHALPWQLTFLGQGDSDGEGPNHLHASHGFDALIGWIPHSILGWWKLQGKPTVLWGQEPPNSRSMAFDYDHPAIGRLAARHMHEQGVRSVATVRRWNFPARTRQFEAFLAESKHLGLEVRRYEVPVRRHPRDSNQVLVS